MFITLLSLVVFRDVKSGQIIEAGPETELSNYIIHHSDRIFLTN